MSSRSVQRRSDVSRVKHKLLYLLFGVAAYAWFRKRKPKLVLPKRRTIADEIAAYHANPPKKGDLMYELITEAIESGRPLEIHTT